MSDLTLIALFDRFESAEKAADGLIRAGIPKAEIALLANNTVGRHPAPITNPVLVEPEFEGKAEAATDLGLGVGAGAVVGGVFGALIKVSSLAIPGIGPVVAAGPWMTIFTSLGAAVGGAVGAFMSQGISSEDAALYAEGLRRGATLLSAHVTERDVEGLSRILLTQGAVDIEKRALSWRAEGWVGFDPEAQPLTAEEVAAQRQRETEALHEASHHKAIRHYVRPGRGQHMGIVSNETTGYAHDNLRDG
jgi:hypothetical protein